ncbi:hypothetical protein FRB94_012550 [Tulasnella sp. JGI-2019a]|nr:hypothetical protein FRB94_012550 [Tulasnella sp. JGI-2019a]
MLLRQAGKLVQGENSPVRASMEETITRRLSTLAPPMLPNEVLDLIIRHCSRSSLLNCCRISRTLHSIAVTYLYEDPFALDRADYPRYIPVRGNLLRRISSLLKTLEDKNHLAKLVRVFRIHFWEAHRRKIPHVLPHLKYLVSFDLYEPIFEIRSSEVREFLAILRDHSPNVQHIKVDVPPYYSPPDENSDLDMIHVLSGFPHLQDIDIAFYRDLDAEPPFSMVQTISKTCPELRFVNWESRSYYFGYGFLPPVHRVFQYALINDVWETVRASEIKFYSSLWV